MATTIVPEAMARYRRSAQVRETVLQRESEQRRQVAWSIARRAAHLLREEFGATRVIAFGSLAHGAWFGPRRILTWQPRAFHPRYFGGRGVHWITSTHPLIST